MTWLKKMSWGLGANFSVGSLHLMLKRSSLFSQLRLDQSLSTLSLEKQENWAMQNRGQTVVLKLSNWVHSLDAFTQRLPCVYGGGLQPIMGINMMRRWRFFSPHAFLRKKRPKAKNKINVIKVKETRMKYNLIRFNQMLLPERHTFKALIGKHWVLHISVLITKLYFNVILNIFSFFSTS